MSATAKKTGRFETRQPRDVADLYDHVRAVAERAVEFDQTLVNPQRITQRAWNATKRQLPEFEHLPNANEICRQLGGRDAPMPWHEVLDIGFDERTSVSIHTARSSRPDDFTVNDDRVFFSMNRIAQELGQTWLTNADYMYGRALLVERDRRRKHGGHLEERLLTYSQIRHYCEQDWNRASEIAELGLTHAADLPVHRGLSAVDALILVWSNTGRFASEKRLRQYARDHDFALANRPRDRGWHVVVEEARQQIVAETGVDPGPYNPDEQAEWETPQERDAVLPERRRYKMHRPEVLLYVIRFVEERPRGARPTTPEWRVFQKKTGAPGMRTLNRNGGLKALVKEASKPGARERAERELHVILHPTPEQKRARAEATAEKKANEPQAQEVMNAIRELGGATSGELAEHLSWAKDTVQVWLRPLKATGRIRSVRVPSGDSRGTVDRYAAADTITAAPLEHDEEAVRKATAKAGRRAYAALAKLGAASAKAVAAELGIHPVPTAKLLTALVQTGFVIHEVSGHPTGRGRLITYTPSGKPLPEIVEEFSPIRRAVYDAVQALEPARINQIAEQVAKKRDAVRWQLEELVRAGYVEKTGTGDKVGGMEVLEYRTTAKQPPADITATTARAGSARR